MPDMQIRNVSFAYSGTTEVLRNITLDLSNETTAIIGQNGAGKTTFVKLLKGLLKPTNGTIRFNGDNIHEVYTISGLACHIGFVFQNPDDQIFKNNVTHEVMFGPLNIGQSEKEARKNAIGALKEVGLEAYMEYNPYDMSLSQRKLIAIASILAMDTDVVIFDEPTMGQDVAGKEILKHIIQNLKRNGKQVICILHDMDFAAEIFDRAVVFHQGHVLLDGSTQEVFSNSNVLKQAHLEKPHVKQLAERLGIETSVLSADELIQTLQKDMI